ncbi:hypothetical protein [Oerskovia turbata]
MSIVLFTLLAALAVVMTDLHDRSFPQSIGARTTVSIDISTSSMKDDQVFADLGALSDELGLGLVKVAPDLSGDQSERVFVLVGEQGPTASSVPLFNDSDAQIRGPETLASSYASGQYLVTGDTARVDEMRTWLNRNAITARWTDDTTAGTLRALVVQQSFGVTVLAAVALLVALVLYWLSVKSRGRSLRVLAGTATRRIQYEDVAGLLVPIVGAALVCGAVTVIAVGAWQGWVFVPFLAQTLVLLGALVVGATLACAVLMSVAAIPSVRMLAERIPEVTTLNRAASIVKAITFALVIATVTPAVAALAESRDVAAQQAQWRALSDEVSIGVLGAIGEDGFQGLLAPLGEVVREAEERDALALSYTWSAQYLTESGGDPGPYEAVALVNPRWLELMGVGTTPDGTSGETTTLEELTATPDDIGDWLLPSLDLWARDGVDPESALASLTAYEARDGASLPLSEAGSGELLFFEDVLVLAATDVHGTFDDDFLGSLLSTSNLVFNGLGATQALVREHGLQDETRVQFIAEEGVLRAQYAAYFAWLQGLSLVALVVALTVAASISAFIVAVMRARRDFPLVLAGARWNQVIGGRVLTDWAVLASITMLVLLLRGFEAVAPVLVTSALAAVVILVTHAAAARWSFRNVSTRRV